MAEIPEVRFRRDSYHGNYATNPLWHIAQRIEPANALGYNLYFAVCGYATEEGRRRVRVSSAQRRPARKMMCSKCLAIVEKS